MNNAKKNILLVGGSGYLGSHLRNFLSSFSVFYTSREEKSTALQLDLLNKSTFKNVKIHSYECIIILAANFKGLGNSELREEYLNTDTKGLPAFLQFIAENKLTKKLIYISSMTIYGTGNSLPVNENADPKPISTYGLSKLLAEQIIAFYCRNNDANGVILRIPGIYGGNRTSGFIYNTALKCLKNQPVELDTSSLGFWETIHIDDLCFWISEFIERYDWSLPIDIFNIGYGTKTDIIECAELIKKTLNSSSPIINTEKKDYEDFYLDHSKIQKYVTVKNKYQESLVNYLKSFSL